MNTIKKALVIFLSVMMIASLAACAGKNTASVSTDTKKISYLSTRGGTEAQQDYAAASGKTAAGTAKTATAAKGAVTVKTPAAAQKSEGAVDGGWSFNQGELALNRNPDAKAAFAKATKGLVGYVYEPIALVGTQVVAGTNYCILCRATPVYPNAESSFALVYIYEDLNGKAEITDIKDFSDSSDSDEPILGGLEMNQGNAAVESNADVKAAFDKALSGLTGCEYETVAYIGSQVVAGTNYSILCRTTPVYPGAVSTFSMVTIYEDLNGNAELGEVTELDL